MSEFYRNRLKAFDKGDMINYIAPKIIAACEDFVTKLIPKSDIIVTVDYKHTVFSYTILGRDPVQVLSVYVDDSVHDGSIVISIPIITNSMDEKFYIRIFPDHVEEDNGEEKWFFAKIFTRTEYGEEPIDKCDINVPVLFFQRDAIIGFIDLNSKIERMLRDIEITMDHRVDVCADDVEEEVDDNEDHVSG
jgi:hypothetical protein